MALSVGARLGPYEILSPLGAGGMGEVYRARDTRLDREVAIKVLPEEFSANLDRLRRFEQEARAASALNHPNIVTIHDVGTQEKSPFVVSELLEGETLRQRLATSALSPRKAMEYALQIARGLAAAHEMEIVHRDLKPENVFVTKDGRVKILDFGLAKLASPRVAPAERTDTPTMPARTESGVVLGTVGYMSPEQVRGQQADHRSDIFSFGSILYEMLTGRRAFRGDSAVETMSAILKEEPPEIPGTSRGIPPGLERVVRHCLEKNREERFQSASDLAFALQETVSRSPASQTATVFPRSRQRSILWFASLGLGLVAVLVLLIAINAGGLRKQLLEGTGRRRIESIAVLPLENLSRDPEQEYFADGMTDALITNLARIGALRVISRTSVMQYKGARKPLPEIARQLNVDAVVEGSVLRSGERVRITAQLIHAPTDKHLWAQAYERSLRDVLSLQAEVAQAIAHEIEIKVTPQERAGLAKARPVDSEAYEAYLKGRYYWNKRTSEAVRTGIEHFEQAIGRDPAYAVAYAGLADSYSVLGSYGFLAPEEVMPKAKAAAQKALEIDETLAEPHTSLAWVIHRYDRDYPAAEREFRRAIQLNPNYATARHWYGLFLAGMGRHAEAMAEMERARQLDPLSLIINTNLGWIQYFDRQYDRAIEQYRRTLEMDPTFSSARWKLREAYERKGMYKEAFAELETNMELWGAKELAAEFRRIYKESGYPAVLRRWIHDYEERARQAYVQPYNIAMLYAELEEKDPAFTWLKKACEERSAEVVHVGVEPIFDSLRSDPRFADLLRCLGLPP